MERSIGIFDSGVGGLTVVRAVRQVLPTWNIVYLGDTARVPYGSKSPRTVERYSLACQAFLLRRQVSLVMIACNTASASALQTLERVSPVPVIDAVGPGARSAVAATRNGHIGILGTLATVTTGAYERAVMALEPSARVTAQACPLLVPLAEEGWIDDDIARAIVRRYLIGVFEREPEIDTLVLGCTHYPLLSGAISAVAEQLSGRDVAVVDSATAMASVALAQLGPVTDDLQDRSRGHLACFATDVSRLDELGARFLGEPLDSFELVDL